MMDQPHSSHYFGFSQNILVAPRVHASACQLLVLKEELCLNESRLWCSPYR
jgi:hypothetical protein